MDTSIFQDGRGGASADTRDRGPHVQELCDLVVRRLGEIVVPQAHGAKVRGHQQTNNIVGLSSQLGDRLSGGRRQGEHQSPGMLGADGAERGTRGAPGRGSVVHPR
jgi:hypothetical protein